MSSSQPNTYVSTFDYARVLQRRWKAILVGLLSGLLIAVVALVAVPKTYTATASILVRSAGEQSEVANGRTSGPVNLDTEAQLVTSSIVATQADSALDSQETIEELADHVTVGVPPNSAVLNISFADPDPERAAAGARAFAEAYLADRQETVDSTVEALNSGIREAMAEVSSELEDVADQLASLPPDSPQRAVPQARNAQLRQQLQSLNTQLGSSGVVGSDVGAIITEPVVPTSPSNPNPRVLVGSAVLLGLLFGLVLALVRERRDHRVHGPFELAQLGLDVLVPVFGVPSDRSLISKSSTRYNMDAIRMLRNSLLAQLPQHRGAILVVPVSDGWAAGSLAANLAANVARTGLDCVSVSTDSRQSGDMEKGQIGLGDVLLGVKTLEDALSVDNSEPQLRTLSAGSEGSLSAELLQGSEVDHVFSELRRGSDVLVAHVAPTSRNADAQSLAPLFDGVVLVAVEGYSVTEDVSAAMEQFSHVSAKILGAAIVTHESETGRRAGWRKLSARRSHR